MEAEEDLKDKWPFPWAYCRDSYPLSLKQHIIGWCGQIYPCLELSYMWKHTDPGKGVDYPHTHCYTLDEVDAFVTSYFKKKDTEVYFGEIGPRYYRSTGPCRKSFKDFYDAVEKVKDKHQKRFEEHLSPIFAATLHGRAYSGYGSLPDRADPGQKIVWNASLRDYDFMRIKDPYTAYQELSMYLGNMAFPNKPIPVISDEVMAEIKGFNKFSFRKDKAT